jgi:hypothetical protein
MCFRGVMHSHLIRFLGERPFSLLASATLGLLLIFTASLYGKQPVPEEQGVDRAKLCYAFLRDGDVWTVCEGKRMQLPLGGKVIHYAISLDGSHFAFLLRKVGPSQKPSLLNDLVIVTLNSEFKTTKSTVGYSRLRPTCGTILAYLGGNWSASNIFTGSVLSFPPNKAFHCDSDARVVLGWNEIRGGTSTDLSLLINGNPERTFAAFLNGGNDFDVSPNGEHLAYFRQPTPQDVELCVTRVDKEAECTKEGGDEAGIDGVSLSNSGDALYSGGTSKSCFYKDMEHFSTKRLPGYSGEDECRGIYFWQPSMQHPALIEELGRYPQWITLEAAAALHLWNPKPSSSSNPVQRGLQ